MSDQYRALTRKYRPQSFDEIVSQRHVSSTLKNALQQNRLSHAYMFSGPRGVGKTTMARVLAREVNQIGENVDGEALNQTLNVIEIDAASNNSVEDIRELRERVRVPPQNGRYKIYIIDEVHMLSKSAFNAFLKTLEEPPDHVIFIFATTEPNKVLPTILSRVQRFDFKRLKVDEIVDRLRTISDRENIEIDDESLHVIAKKADGALRDALGLMDQAISFCGDTIQHEELLRALNVVSTDRLFDLTDAVEVHDANRGLDLVNEVLREGYDIQEFLTELLEHLRNLYVAKNSEQLYLVEASENTKKRYRSKAEVFSRNDLMRMLHIASEAQHNVKEAQQPRIQFEVAILKLIHMQRSRTLQNLISGLEELKKNYSSSNGSDQTTSSSQQSERVTTGSSSDRSSGHSVEEQGASNGTSGSTTAKNMQKEPSEPTAPSSPADPSTQADADSNGAPNASADSTADQKTREQENRYKNHDFFGNSSLNKYQSQLDHKPPEKKHQPTARPDEEKQQKPEQLNVADLKESWNKFVKQFEDEVSQMLFLQLERMEPVDLSNRTVILRCENSFAQKLIREHRRKVTRGFSQFVGTGLQIDSKVVNSESSEERSKSPYERFKDLQNKDPKIKTIVEMFGAELEY